METNLLRASVVEGEAVNRCHLGVQDLLLSLQLLLHLPCLLEGLAHGLVVVQVASGSDGRQQVCRNDR